MVSNKYCIIMAGGVGSRFWPVSRYAHPKQFLDILGTGRSFLQTTVDRFKRIVPVENILIVSAKQYEGLIAQQVPEIPKDNVLLENRKRNTAPCIAYATYKLYKKDPSATVVVTPADHLILNEDVFLETVETVLNHACTSDALFTLGIKPTRPETQYGYIQANKAKAEIVSGHASYQVKTFTEKPDLEMAKVLFSSGEFLWNSGIFIWNLKTIISMSSISTGIKRPSRKRWRPISRILRRLLQISPSITIRTGSRRRWMRFMMPALQFQ